jgi:hypothetical protein
LFVELADDSATIGSPNHRRILFGTEQIQADDFYGVREIAGVMSGCG